MPVLTNPRHERFAQELAKGKSASEAYEIAGYSPNRGNAVTLKQQESVSKRVSELMAEREEIARAATQKATESLAITVESLLAEVEQARLLAMEIGQPAAAIGAIKEKGVLSGLRVEKSERKTTTDVRSLTDDELQAAIAEALALEGGAEASGDSYTAH